MSRCRSLSTRLDRLEAAILPRGPACECCGYPEHEAILVVVTADDSPLPTCEACDRLLHAESRRPLGREYARIIVHDNDPI